MPQPADPIALFIVPLETAGLRYVVTGAFAASVYGDPRLTNDIDIILEASAADAARIHALFVHDDLYVPPIETLAEEGRRKRDEHFNLVHGASGLRADVYLAGDMDLGLLSAWVAKRGLEEGSARALGNSNGDGKSE